jgi:hypothetical protein
MQATRTPDGLVTLSGLSDRDVGNILAAVGILPVINYPHLVGGQNITPADDTFNGVVDALSEVYADPFDTFEPYYEGHRLAVRDAILDALKGGLGFAHIDGYTIASLQQAGEMNADEVEG